MNFHVEANTIIDVKWVSSTREEIETWVW